MLSRKTKIIVILIVAGLIVVGGLYLNRGTVRDIIFEIQKPAVPKPAFGYRPTANGQQTTAAAGQAAREQSPAPSSPDEINLDVPFTPQAPFGVWDAFHEDGCEEASVLMVGRFWQNRPIKSPEDADRELYALRDLEDKIFGYNKDTTAEETARLMQEFYGFKKVEVRYNMSVDDIKTEVGAGYPVILPLDGRGPLNPYFRGNGPDYHMLVVKGYTKDGKFITNDPGTKRGKDYVYDEQYLFDRIHDWNGGDVANGQKAMIIARPN